MVFVTQLSTILHEEDSTLHGSKHSLHMWIRTLFMELTIMHSIWKGDNR